MAPSKPLVDQQISACHSIMGIPEHDTAHLEGSVPADKRSVLWESKRVFFCTPQTLLNDLMTARCDPRQVVCLVVDEAHKATDNYAYTSIVAEICRVSDHMRVLALSATPGSDTAKIQKVRLSDSSLQVCIDEENKYRSFSTCVSRMWRSAPRTTPTWRSTATSGRWRWSGVATGRSTA